MKTSRSLCETNEDTLTLYSLSETDRISGKIASTHTAIQLLKVESLYCGGRSPIFLLLQFLRRSNQEDALSQQDSEAIDIL